MRCFENAPRAAMRALFLAGACSVPAIAHAANVVAASSAVFSVNAVQWAAPRSGTTVAALPGLSAALQEVIRQPGNGLMLHYPENEQGEVWVEELRGWLVSLGLASHRIQVQPGNTDGVIDITLIATVQTSSSEQGIAPAVIVEPFAVDSVPDVNNGVEIP